MRLNSFNKMFDRIVLLFDMYGELWKNDWLEYQDWIVWAVEKIVEEEPNPRMRDRLLAYYIREELYPFYYVEIAEELRPEYVFIEYGNMFEYRFGGIVEDVILEYIIE